MIKKMLMLFMIMIVFAAVCSAEQDGLMSKLLKAKYIEIYWDKGVFTTWEKGWPWEGYPLTKRGKFNQRREESKMIFDKIDIENGRAEMKYRSTDYVDVIFTSEGLSFVDKTGLDNLTIVTISPYLDKSAKYVAVMSRHTNFPGIPIPSQYYGVVEEIK